jgi:hypothetical protein
MCVTLCHSFVFVEIWLILVFHNTWMGRHKIHWSFRLTTPWTLTNGYSVATIMQPCKSMSACLFILYPVDSSFGRLSDANTFDQTCVSLLERMINIVPKGVQLSEPIWPIENKVTHTKLYVSSKNEGELVFKTSVRVSAFVTVWYAL